jgi:glycosyltransferase involved in cell wall biosynthesis
MKILLCHSHYREPGGEDQVFAAEQALLRSRGHDVVTYTRHNDELESLGRLRQARTTLWNSTAYRELRTLIQREQPQLMHCTNLFPLISPSAYRAARDEGVAVVQSLHNYRLLCPKAQFLRRDQVCEACLGKSIPWPGVVHACYRDSFAASAVVAALLALHRLRGTWTRDVDQYIALTEFSRRKFVAGGLPADRLSVKPNFLAVDPGPGEGRGEFVVYAGRLSPEKGIGTLLDAWSQLGGRIPLTVIGDGPLAGRVQEAATRDRSIQWRGRLPHPEVLEILGQARFLVFPSHCYETFGLSIIEAFARGTPVVAPRLGAMGELIEHDRTGLLVPPANAAALADAVRRLWAEEDLREQMRIQVRQEFEARYTAERNYELLRAIYQQAMAPPAANRVLDF